MSPHRYLITGGSGFLGHIIGDFLKKTGNIVITLGRAHNDINTDITKPVELDNELDIDVVIHTAGKAHITPRTKRESLSFFEINFQGTRNLCYALDRLKKIPKSFIFISTVSVYGLDKGYLINESQKLKGITPYAKSKIAAEEWLKIWTKKKGIKLSILRLPLIAGPNPPGNLGSMIAGIRSGYYVSIGKANSRKSMVWAEDIAQIIPKVSEIGGIFNLTDGYHPSFKELEDTIAIILSKKRPKQIPKLFAILAGYAGDLFGSRFPVNTDKIKKITSTLTFDDMRARKRLGWTPSNVLEKLSETLNPNQ